MSCSVDALYCHGIAYGLSTVTGLSFPSKFAVNVQSLTLPSVLTRSTVNLTPSPAGLDFAGATLERQAR